MSIKDYLGKVIEEKRAKIEELEKRADGSESIEEVRSIGETLKALRDEINKAEEQLKATEEEPKDPKDPKKEEPKAPTEEKKRSFNPLATYALRDNNSAEVEKRAAEFAASGKMKIAGTEARAILTTGKLAKPTGAAGVNDAFNQVASIIDQVTVEDCTGMGGYNVAFEVSAGTAGMATDGVASAESAPTFKNAYIQPFLVDTLAYVSREIRKQTPVAYEEKVRQCAMTALRKKVANLILTGNGSTEPFGILNAKDTESTPGAIYKTLEVSANTIDEKTLRNIVFEYGGDENVGAKAVLYLNKNDLIAFGDVRGTSDKKAVYEITPDGNNPNTGIIKDGGLAVPYCICSGLTSLADSTQGTSAIKTMAYGDPMNYTTGLFGDYEIRVSEDYKFAEKLLTINGEVMVGGNLTVSNGFVVVTLAAS